jgi:hypothetical protein
MFTSVICFIARKKMEGGGDVRNTLKYRCIFLQTPSRNHQVLYVLLKAIYRKNTTILPGVDICVLSEDNKIIALFHFNPTGV